METFTCIICLLFTSYVIVTNMLCIIIIFSTKIFESQNHLFKIVKTEYIVMSTKFCSCLPLQLENCREAVS